MRSPTIPPKVNIFKLHNAQRGKTLISKKSDPFKNIQHGDRKLKHQYIYGKVVRDTVTTDTI